MPLPLPFAIFLQAASLPSLPPGIEALEQPAQEIVVTGHRGPPVPKAEPIEYYRRHCFDPNRLSGRSAPPTADPDWLPLDEDLRESLGIADPSTPAFVLRDSARDHLLILKFEQLPGRWKTIETRCTLFIVGGTAHDGLTRAMNKLFRGPGTERHLGQPDGSQIVPGWRQRLWSAMPARGSKSWQVVQAARGARAAGTWVVVSSPSFYTSYDYVIGDLKTKAHGRPSLSVLSFALIHQP